MPCVPVAPVAPVAPTEPCAPVGPGISADIEAHNGVLLLRNTGLPKIDILLKVNNFLFSHPLI
jgi:hypothetical protein